MKLKVALYVRVSTSYQENGMDSQRKSLVDYCQKNNLLDPVIYEDFNQSGAKSSRPRLNDLMNDVRSGSIHTVIVYSFSRFARSTKHLLDAMEEFKSLNTKFISISENVDTATALGQAMFTIISAIAQLEREILSERVRNGLRGAKARGKVLGRPKTTNSDLIRQLSQQRMTLDKIAEIANCSRTTVVRELKKTGS